MAANLDQLKVAIEGAVVEGFRGRLIARGQARGMVWRDGVLPQDAPNFSAELSDELLSYGYALLRHGLHFTELGGEGDLARKAFAIAAEALEAVVAKGPRDPESDFHRFVAAAAYHLGRYSAQAYSLLRQRLEGANLAGMEIALAKLMLRDLDGLGADIHAWFASGKGSDDAITSTLAEAKPGWDDEEDSNEKLDLLNPQDPLTEAALVALEDNFMAALSIAMLAMERGDESLMLEADRRLIDGLVSAEEMSLVPAWWCYRLARHLLTGLWHTSFHVVLPRSGPPGQDVGDWLRLRRLFIATMYRRSKAELELWPSQLQAAKRVLDATANLVMSLPTSAGKTRIAELCILSTLGRGRRVVFVTPLRALSAQTEVGLRRTFGPLGKSVSSLYGSIGASGTDVDALRKRDIVVATPEKLDFALRSDPQLLDDVGLVVLDEGHMIGLTEREVRYEAQIQRLLRRPDAADRRVICLSAILPDGDQLEDFAAWLTRDRPDGLIKDGWRPTRLRYGEVDWRGDHARLNVTVGEEKPFISNFLTAKMPTQGKARKLFPSDQGELCIATSWRLVADGQTVLVFCPERRQVLPFARDIIEMHKRGHIASVLQHPPAVLGSAIAVGMEWFGPDHEILKCLKLGVAIHHGALPTPYRREIERLLREGVLRITVSSPTLAQGLNLSATSLVFRGLTRGGDLIQVAEFRNVVGRAGRAFIDVEGLVLYPMFDRHAKRRAQWKELVDDASGREMESGLLRLLVALILRMRDKLGESTPLPRLLEYVAGQGAWEFPVVEFESAEAAAEEQKRWEQHLASLDTAIFSLLGDAVVPDDQIAAKIDEVLTASLFNRRLARYAADVQDALPRVLHARVNYIWQRSTAEQRRGWFLAGVGFKTGLELDTMAPRLEGLLLDANLAISKQNWDPAIAAITDFAEIAFQIPPFRPEKLLADWRPLLDSWLRGQPLGSALAASDDAIQCIEQAFVYNLPWAMEAVRVRFEAHADPVEAAMSMAWSLFDFPRAPAVAALETGTLSGPAAILIQAGFGSRVGAIAAVGRSGATFDSMEGLMEWLATDDIRARSAQVDWPTYQAHGLWLEFVGSGGATVAAKWSSWFFQSPVHWTGAPVPPGQHLRIGGGPGKERCIYTADFKEVGTIGWIPNTVGLFIATAARERGELNVEYLGPDIAGAPSRNI